ncbi:class C beta-lactamase-related serine hydrolase [Massilia arenosa]|uniref:Class C beta-lactamase-related serine hydrolase n=1 Tax=Zemynaea arenosa TaxID=2561931 RepID=A0A4Y9SB76_9BURK|nr:serine hydrolase [Massilia arenosa]TFW17871.1 class C beta-lactamase-related serine hydrolase [Massilia arenosa]
MGMDGLTRELQAIVDDPALPLAGLAAVAIRDGAVVYQHAFGYKRLPSSTTPKAYPIRLDGETMFRIASISKLVSTLGVMTLIEQGVLDLDADLGRYLGYSLRHPRFPDRPLTLRMLLTHRSSLCDAAGLRWGPEVDLRAVLLPGGHHFGTGAIWAPQEPGSWFAYANVSWGVLATVLEAATGKRFDRLMRRLVFDPLGLKAGFYLGDFAPARLDDVATLYRRREKDGAERWDPQGPWIAQIDDFGAAPPAAPPGLDDYVPGTNGTLFGPQGGLRISAAELARIMLMLMNGGRDGELQLLQPATVDLMFSRQWTFNGRNGTGDSDTFRGLHHAWGLGNQHFLDVSGSAGGRACGDRLVAGGGFTGVGHLGWAWGLNALFVFDRARRDGLIWVSSGVGADPDTCPGCYSSNARFQERITDALYRQVLAP